MISAERVARPARSACSCGELVLLDEPGDLPLRSPRGPSARPASTNFWSTSLSTTGMSAEAMTWAISPPIDARADDRGFEHEHGSDPSVRGRTARSAASSYREARAACAAARPGARGGRTAGASTGGSALLELELELERDRASSSARARTRPSARRGAARPRPRASARAAARSPSTRSCTSPRPPGSETQTQPRARLRPLVRRASDAARSRRSTTAQRCLVVPQRLGLHRPARHHDGRGDLRASGAVEQPRQADGADRPSAIAIQPRGQLAGQRGGTSAAPGGRRRR